MGRKKLRQGIDLARPQFWFITVRTKAGFPLFGAVTRGQILLSPAGQIAHDLWQRVPEIYPFTKLHGFVVMTDHIHMLLEIKKNQENVKSLSRIIGYYKQQVTKHVLRLNDPDNPRQIWLRSFWARGFRNVNELFAYERYIRDNPVKESAPFREAS